MDSFYDSFLENLDDDEIRTIFFKARSAANIIRKRSVCDEFPSKDADVMSLAMTIALELLCLYENTKDS